MELLIARNPDPYSTLPLLLWLPVADGLVFRTKDNWPRTTALYCHPVPAAEWPADPDLIERVPLRSCARRGVAIDVVADRGREQRSQIVFTNARGRQRGMTTIRPEPALGLGEGGLRGVLDLIRRGAAL